MPRIDIDYSNTIIYKIACKDKAITDVYVGHTTNFVQRKHSHKQSCINIKSPNYNFKVYEVIRLNGGWSNWKMEIINFFNCADHCEARKKEQEYFVSLNATLNSIDPFPKPKPQLIQNIIKPIFGCNTCNVRYRNEKQIEKHNKTKKHMNAIKPEELEESKSAENYVCEFCHTVCSKKNDWDRHLQTNKHLRKSGNKMETPKPAPEFNCKCGKHYNTKSGLWKHTKTCQYKPIRTQYIKNDPNETFPPDISFLTNLVLEVVKNNAELQKQNSEYQKQNQEIQKQMLDLYKTSTTNNQTINNTNNSHNKTFNLQFFLNEQCKNAMNIMEFVDSMTLELSDLEDVGKLGYVEGISNIIIRKLNELDVYTRPIHCSDAKREIMYVKDDNIWEKENSTYDKLRKAIKRVTYKNSSLLLPWSQKYPACMNNQHHLNDVYIQLVGQAMGGKEEFVDSENKIMKKIAKAVLIEK